MGTFLLIATIAAFIVAAGAFVFLFETRSSVTDKALSIAALGNYAEAKAMVRDQLDLEPDDVQLLFLMSRIYKLEGDHLSEAEYLERIVEKGNFTKDVPASKVTQRIAAIYYELDQLEKSFFYYLENLEHDPRNIESLIRLAFMCLGQKEFDLAEKFFRQIPEENIRIAYYFIGRGVTAVMLEKNNEHEYFKKAYDLDSRSTVNAFLYAMSLFRIRRFQEALDIANTILDEVSDDYLRYTLFQFVMVQNMCLSDYLSAILYCKYCIEIAMANNMEQELAESNLYCGALHIANGDIEDASEYLIDAEYRRVNDPEVINLANYKFDLEEGNAKPGMTSARGFNFKNFLMDIPDRLFPGERSYELSGLRTSTAINIRGMLNSDGVKILPKLALLTPDKISRFLSLKGNAYKSVAAKIMSELGYKVKKELPCLDSEGANYLGVNAKDELALFRFRRWKGATVSDVFLNEYLANIGDYSAKKGFLVGSYDLSVGGKRFIKRNDAIVIINDKELDRLLAKVMK